MNRDRVAALTRAFTDKRLLVIKQQRKEVAAPREAIGGRWPPSAKRDDLPTAREQRLGDEAAAVGEDAGDRPLHSLEIAPHTPPIHTRTDGPSNAVA